MSRFPSKKKLSRKCESNGFQNLDFVEVKRHT